MTPISRLTYRASIAMTAAAALCIILGLFIPAALLGTTAAINLLAGTILRKY